MRHPIENANRTGASSSENLAHHLEHSPLAVIEWDQEFRVLRWSGDAETIFGWKSEEVVGRSYFDIQLVYEPDERRLMSELRTLLNGQAKNVVIRHRNRKKSGELVTIEWFDTIVTNDTGEVISYLSIGRDLTDELKTQEELREAKKLAEEANALKSRFLANMSHEIRAPLGAILGFAELMSDPELLPGDRAEYFQIIQRNGTYVEHLIDDILDLAKVEAGRLAIDPIEVEPSQLIEEALVPHRRSAEERGVRLSLCYQSPGLEKIKTDPVRFKQILSNLVGNAVKFTRQGEVAVVVSAAATHSGRASYRVQVRDSGPGLSPQNQQRLFEPFFQVADSGFRGVGGTGLGLALSRHLARLLGGDVRLLKSEVGKGSEFVMSIDSGEPNSSLNQSNSSNASPVSRVSDNEKLPLQSVRVLLVEDSPDNQVLMKKLLTKRGAIVDLASDGLEGVQKAMQGEHDVVLMDIQMPRLDGYHATQELRSARFTKPIIALTAHAMKDERQRCLDAGCDDHLSKPVNASELVRMIRGLAIGAADAFSGAGPIEHRT